MAQWTHSICTVCWDKKNPDRPANKLVEGYVEPCCFCGQTHHSGIYIRHDPKDPELKCEPDHE